LTVLIDSWTWIEYWSGGPKANEAAAHIDGSEAAVVSAINIAEVYHWILLHYDVKIAEEKIDTIKRRCFIIPVSEEIAIEAAKIKHSAKLALTDSFILATAKGVEAKVVTGDPDFRELKEAVFIDP